MKNVTTIIIIYLISKSLYAQNFKRQVTSKWTEAIYGNTMYIKEINQGLICNEDDHYQILLKAGKYTAEYKFLGYKSMENERAKDRILYTTS